MSELAETYKKLRQDSVALSSMELGDYAYRSEEYDLNQRLRKDRRNIEGDLIREMEAALKSKSTSDDFLCLTLSMAATIAEVGSKKLTTSLMDSAFDHAINGDKWCVRLCGHGVLKQAAKQHSPHIDRAAFNAVQAEVLAEKDVEFSLGTFNALIGGYNKFLEFLPAAEVLQRRRTSDIIVTPADGELRRTIGKVYPELDIERPNGRVPAFVYDHCGRSLRRG